MAKFQRITDRFGTVVEVRYSGGTYEARYAGTNSRVFGKTACAAVAALGNKSYRRPKTREAWRRKKETV